MTREADHQGGHVAFRYHGRTLLLLLRDTRGRFTRIRATITETPARRRVRRPRPVLAAVQLALF